MFINGTCVTSEAYESQWDEDMVVFHGLPKECSNSDLINIGSNFTIHKSHLMVGTAKYSIDQYCLVELPDGTAEAQLCMTTDFSDVSARIICICMITSLIFFIFSWLLVWKFHKDKLFGAMTLGMITMLFLYFLTFLIMDLVELGKIVCNVSLLNNFHQVFLLNNHVYRFVDLSSNSLICQQFGG